MALLLQAVVYGQWAADGGIRDGAPGDYEISPGRLVIIWGFQGFLVLGVIVFGVLLVRDCRRARTVTLPAALFVGFYFCVWLDPILNYRYLTYIANRQAPNVTSWGPYIPGWNPPHPELAIESLFAASGFVYGLMVAWPLLQWLITDRIAAKRPHWGMARLLAATMVVGVVVDTVAEGLWLQTGLLSYPSSLQALSLFGGHWYQVPLQMGLMVALLFGTPIVMMRLYAIRHGTTVHIFRGSETVSTRWSGWLRLLAGIGFTNVLILVFCIVAQFVQYFAGTDPMPADTPAYLWPR
ncbi:spirocyclase AveC family protein [Streptomyces sp. KLMMK]|uniref:spirocyclase AveC family protein n=1 Tax=Streptomyces sp. KLMMK TaxID=3109353 RepID=UPI00300858FA